jgi:hypothetical protein
VLVLQKRVASKETSFISSFKGHKWIAYKRLVTMTGYAASERVQELQRRVRAHCDPEIWSQAIRQRYQRVY